MDHAEEESGALRARLSLAPASGGRRAEGRSRLLADGADTGRVLDGLRLEAAFRTEFGALLLLTHDCPHEELLHAYLLDAAWRVRDEVSLGAPYTSGELHDLTAVDANTYTFGFFGEDDAWTLEAHAPRWRLHPLASTAFHLSGPVQRPLKKLVSRSWLRLSGSYTSGDGHRVALRS